MMDRPFIPLALAGWLVITGSATAATAASAAAAPTKLSFCREPFVHPQLVQDLLSWESDNGDQVVAINLLEANESNRYSGEIKTRGLTSNALHHPTVYSRFSEGGVEEEEGYYYVGLTRSGVHVLATWSFGGGTLISNRLLLVTVEQDRGIQDVEMPKEGKVHLKIDRPRLLLRKLGEIILGDRWDGELRVVGNDVVVGKDVGWFSDKHVHNIKDVTLQLEDAAVRPGILEPCP
jgi:hypothetical protein